MANRRLFVERLEREIRRSRSNRQPLSLAYLDCDDFKRINDQLGHEAGDQVLRSVADLLEASVRRGETVARLGGDEFALLLPATGEADARATTNRVLDGLAAARLPSSEGTVSLSAGVATFRGGAATVGEVLRQADRLLFEAKCGGKGRATYRTIR